MIARVSVVLNRAVIDSVYRTGCRNVSDNHCQQQSYSGLRSCSTYL